LDTLDQTAVESVLDEMHADAEPGDSSRALAARRG
jgi:hypothetical protein